MLTIQFPVFMAEDLNPNELDHDVQLLIWISFRNCESGSRCRTDVDLDPLLRVCDRDPVHRACDLDPVQCT